LCIRIAGEANGFDPLDVFALQTAQRAEHLADCNSRRLRIGRRRSISLFVHSSDEVITRAGIEIV
jgi:hypothetical protein